MDDQIAITRLKQGDPGGLEALVGHYQVQAVYAAHMILGDRALAEEAAQTAFVRIVEKIHQYDQSRPFAPWFFRIVVNEALKTARLQKRMLPLDEEPDKSVRALSDWLADPQPQPERLLELEETRRVVLEAIQRLTPEQRAAVVMRYYLEMSAADMSVKLDRPVSTVKWWLRAARGRLRSLLRSSRMFEDED
jgi:RNA polymerase sigma-70 factor (ECF subfamily)